VADGDGDLDRIVGHADGSVPGDVLT